MKKHGKWTEYDELKCCAHCPDAAKVEVTKLGKKLLQKQRKRNWHWKIALLTFAGNRYCYVWICCVMIGVLKIAVLWSLLLMHTKFKRIQNKPLKIWEWLINTTWYFV